MSRHSYLRREVPTKDQRSSRTTKEAHFLGTVSKKILINLNVAAYSF